MTTQTTQQVRYPIGLSDFDALITGNYLHVDKTLMIKDVINDGCNAIVITRPRRFGKTINMSMLKYFFAIPADGQSKRHLFTNTLLEQQHPELIEQYQGQFPVIFISLKDVKEESYSLAEEQFQELILSVYREHYYLVDSDHLSEIDKIEFRKFINGNLNTAKLKNSLKILTAYLHKHYQRRVIVLIDEYDTPIQKAYLSGYYDEMISLIRGFFGAALKDNVAVEKSVTTGILRIAKESIFSDLNNVKIRSILDEQYCQYFGFTIPELDNMLNQVDMQSLRANLIEWYNGYIFGYETVLNPWSIINCLENKGKYETYWLGTSSNDLIHTLMTKSTAPIKSELEALMQGHEIEMVLDQNIQFTTLLNADSSIWRLLLSSGYVTAKYIGQEGSKLVCRLRLPNQEIKAIFTDIIQDWFVRAIGIHKYHNMLGELVVANVEVFYDILQEFILKSTSYLDFGGEQCEQYYHVFVLGMLVNLRNTHHILSNRESGHGRYDVAIIPNNAINDTAIIMEFKADRENKKDLKTLAEEALAQIFAKDYSASINKDSIQKILRIGLSFRSKKVEIAYDIEII